MLNAERRMALMRYHTALHVLNTIALRDYKGWITGVQIAPDYARIDFKLEGFSAAICAELEWKVNAVLGEDHAVRSYYLTEAEFRKRDDLLRTLEAKPPVSQGQVRVVEIEGFDAQACGGTHVRATSEVGRFSIFRTENKGRINKRLYVRLDPAGP
jgi:misacylated tRNA(Ala) deacylase